MCHPYSGFLVSGRLWPGVIYNFLKRWAVLTDPNGTGMFLSYGFLAALNRRPWQNLGLQYVCFPVIHRGPVIEALKQLGNARWWLLKPMLVLVSMSRIWPTISFSIIFATWLVSDMGCDYWLMIFDFFEGLCDASILPILRYGPSLYGLVVQGTHRGCKTWGNFSIVVDMVSGPFALFIFRCDILFFIWEDGTSIADNRKVVVGCG